MGEKNSLLIPASILGACFLLGAIILAWTWKSNYNANQTITVTGSARQDIVSDLAILKGTLSAQQATADAAYRQLQNEKPALLSYLKSKGFPENKIDFSAITNYPVYEMGPNGYQTTNVKGYVYTQRIEIQSNDVNKIKEISIDISSLIEKGVDFKVDNPEYYYTKLAELKIQIQAAAAKDAMVRADKIAEATGRSLGPMRDARMGGLQITPTFSNQVSDYGINDNTSIDKVITAVVSASFKIE